MKEYALKFFAFCSIPKKLIFFEFPKTLLISNIIDFLELKFFVNDFINLDH